MNELNNLKTHNVKQENFENHQRKEDVKVYVKVSGKNKKVRTDVQFTRVSYLYTRRVLSAVRFILNP